jgi:predicted dehydrogenase
MIGVAVIGLGNAFVPHAKSLADLADRVRVVWLASRDAGRVAAAAANHAWPATNDITRAVQDPAVDAVLILTPANTHLDVAEAAFAAGKHVLCEKPLDATTERAERLVAAGRRAGRRLGVVLQTRFRRGSRRLYEAVMDGALGKVEAASMSAPWWRPQSYYDQPGRGTKQQDGGGVLITQAIHAIDLFRWLVGISRVDAAQVRQTTLHKMETEDYATALVRLGNGAPGTITATTSFYPGRPEWMEIIGTNGTARLERGSLRLSFLDGREETLADDAGSGSGANVMAFSHHAHRELLTGFIDAIETNRDPSITGEEALATQRVIDAILTKGSN